MGLGNTGLNSFKPKASNTAASIISAVPASESKKTSVLQLRIDEDVLITFKEICNQRAGKGAMSTALRNFIMDAIASNGEICNFKE